MSKSFAEDTLLIARAHMAVVEAYVVFWGIGCVAVLTACSQAGQSEVIVAILISLAA